MTTQRLNKFLAAYAAAVTAASLILLLVAFKGQKTARFDELTVERLNVVEPDGKPRFIIANRPRFPGIYHKGKHYRHVGREGGRVPVGGFIYCNDDGTEAGGLIVKSAIEGGGQVAATSLTFDQVDQDQILALQYYQEPGSKPSAGLRVWDQPDGSMESLLVLSDQAAKASGQERDRILKQMGETAAQLPRFGERLFVGKRSGDSLLELSDNKGQARLVLKVTEAGAPSVEFRDAGGRVTKRFIP